MSSTARRLVDRWLRGTGVGHAGVYQDSFRASLPSALPGAHFDAAFTVTWFGHSNYADAGASAVRHDVQEWAAQRTAGRSVAQIHSVENDLNLALGERRPVRQTGMHLLNGKVALGASPEAQRAAQEWDELKRQLALDRLRHETELEQLTYLRERIFSQPSVARSYWIKHHPNALDDLLDDRFERIAEKLGPPSESPHRAIARLVTDFLTGLSAAEREYLVAQLGQVFASFGRHELASRLPQPLTPPAASPDTALPAIVPEP